jgi:hypothetical protein
MLYISHKTNNIPRKKMPKIEEVKSSSAPKSLSKPVKPIVETFEEPDRDLRFSISWEGDFEDSSGPSSSSRRTWKLENGKSKVLSNRV